jgi:hypothetical protein
MARQLGAYLSLAPWKKSNFEIADNTDPTKSLKAYLFATGYEFKEVQPVGATSWSSGTK